MIRIFLSFFFLFCALYVGAREKISSEKPSPLPSPDIHFDILTVKNGLPYNNVTSMVKDKLGFIWISTLEGLCRYDGASFITFKNNPADSSTIISNQVWHLAVDSKGIIWGSTGPGLFNYNPATGKFKNYYPNAEDSTTISCDNLGRIFIDSRDNIYIGGWNEFNIYNSSTKTFRHYKHDKNNPSSIRDSRVGYTLEDHSGRIWVGTYSGLDLFLPELGTFQHINLPSFFESGALINDIYEDDKGNLWLSTWANGIIRYNVTTGEGKAFRIEPERQANGSNNVCTKIMRTQYAGEKNKLWVASRSSGLYLFDIETESFTRFIETELGNPKFVTLDLNYLFDDEEGNIFIATNTGILKYSRSKQLFNTVTLPINSEKCHSDIFSVYQDPADSSGNTLLLGTWTCGGYRYNMNDKTLSQLYEISKTSDTLKQYSTVHNFYRDSKKNLWAFCQEGIYIQSAETGKWKLLEKTDADENKLWSSIVSTYQEEADGSFWFSCYEGLMHYYPSTGITKRVRFDPTDGDKLDVRVAFTFCESPKNIFWIVGARGVLIKYNAVTGETKYFRHDKHNPKSFPVTYDLLEIYSDSKHRIWMGSGNGLIVFNTYDSIPIFKVYHTTDGLPTEMIHTIREDANGKIWCATQNGISTFDTKTSLFRNYGTQEGLFKINVSGAFSASSFGKIFMGFKSTVQYFDPLHIGKNIYSGPLYVTGIKILGKEFVAPASASYRDSLKLSYKQNEITVSFAMLNYADAEQTTYDYYLEGLNDDWIPLGKNHSVTFTNLGGGRYRLHVRGYNADGVAGEDKTLLTLIITPPFWKTNWFYAAVILLIAASMTFYNRWRVRNLRRQKAVLEETVAHRTEQLRIEKERAEQLVDEKEMLMKEIHHRVKNNLEVISSLLELQSEGIDDSKAKAAVIEGQSRVQSIALIHHKLYRTDDVSSVEFKGFANDLYKQVSSVFKKEGTEVDFKIVADETQIPIDSAVPIGLILNELLTNTFKYAISDSKANNITIELHPGINGHQSKITYSDNGPGMPVHFDLSKSASLGMRVIQLLTRQLGGTLSYYNDNGSVFEIPFNNKPA